MGSPDHDHDVTAVGDPQSPIGNRGVSFQIDPTVIQVDGAGGDDNDDSDGPSSSSPIALHHSARLRGYIILFVSALYNFISASNVDENEQSKQSKQSRLRNLCFYVHNFGTIVQQKRSEIPRLHLSMACSMITMITVGVIILCHLDVCTPLRTSVWPKVFGKNGRIELCILVALVVFWVTASMLITSILGPAGEGKDHPNLYFSSWICCWACFWTLEQWCTASGRASFVKFVSSWPNRCPLWILTFLLSFVDFFFALDLRHHFAEGAKFNPYVFKLYSDVNWVEWTLLLVVTSCTFLVSLAWALAEIFRESHPNVESVKSDVEKYVEGITAHILTIMWIVLVCIVTMPGGAASLLGNLYFTTWATLFAVVSTLFWYLRDCRKDIAAIIREEEEEYELVKRTIRRREEKRLAKLAKEQKEKDQSEGKVSNIDTEESKLEQDDDGVLCEDDPAVDDDITISITSNYKKSDPGASSFASQPNASSDKTPPAASVSTSSKSLFISALSYIYPLGADEDAKPKGDGN